MTAIIKNSFLPLYRSGDPEQLDRLLPPLDVHRTQRFRRDARAGAAGRIQHLARDQDLRTELLVQLLDARGEDHDVAGDGVLLALRRTDVAGDRLASVQSDTDRDRRN